MTSRLAAVESLVARGTFSIDSSTYVDTIDKVKIGQHFYSEKPPGHAVLAAIVYFPLYHLGLRFTPGRNAAYAILTFATNGLSTILALLFFFRALAWLELSQRLRVSLTACVACATLVLPYSTTFNVHGFAAAWLFIGFYWLLCGTAAEGQRRWLLLSGLAFSLCAAVDHGTAFFYLAFCVELLMRSDRRREVLWFLLPAFFTLVPTAAAYYSIGGSFKPFAARPELFAYPGSPWIGTDDPSREALTGAGWNSPWFALRYGFLCLFGPRGFLIYNPLIWIAIYGMAHTIRRCLKFWREAAAIAAASAMMMLYYFFASTNFSGWSYSIRWFVPVLFLWWFFAAASKDRLTSQRRLVAVLVLVPVSLLYAVGGVADPWPRASLGYSAPLFNLNGLREPAHSLSLTFSPNPVPRGSDGKWSFLLMANETGGVGVKMTQLVMGGVNRSSGIAAAFGGNHLGPHATGVANMNLAGYNPPFDLVFGVEGEGDDGRLVRAQGTVRLLP